MSTDFTTPQNDTELEISVNLPSSFYVPRTETKEFRGTKVIAGSASKGFRCYLTSTAYDYAITGCTSGDIDFGDKKLLFTVGREGNNFVFRIFALAYPTDRTFSGQAQTITAHIQTFIDPFNPEM